MAFVMPQRFAYVPPQSRGVAGAVPLSFRRHGAIVDTPMSTAGVFFHVWSTDDGNVFCCEPHPTIILHIDSVSRVDPAALCQRCFDAIKRTVSPWIRHSGQPDAPITDERTRMTHSEWHEDSLTHMQQKSEENLFDFLRTDLDQCFTFCDVVETELRSNEREPAQQAATNAENGYLTIQRFLPRLRKEEHRSEIQMRLDKLRTRLDSLRRILSPEA